jgi:uncharacterized protein with GYD domain
MHFVIIGEHGPEICPTSNAKSREMLLQVAPQIPKIAEQAGVRIVAGPYVNREHVTVAVVETSSPENLDRFIVESRLAQWNRVRILPSLSMAEGIRELQDQAPLF